MRIKIELLQEMLELALGDELIVRRETLDDIGEAVDRTLVGPAAEAHDHAVLEERAARASMEPT